MAHQTRGWITYTPSQAGWVAMSIKADSATAANNGKTLAATPPQDDFWPLKHNDLRCVYGIDSAGKRDSCIATEANGTLFQIGSTWVDAAGNSYTTYGLRNERYRTRDLK